MYARCVRLDQHLRPRTVTPAATAEPWQMAGVVAEAEGYRLRPATKVQGQQAAAAHRVWSPVDTPRRCALFPSRWGVEGTPSITETQAFASRSYGTNKKTRDQLPSGFKKFRVFNEADLEMLLMNNRTYDICPTNSPTASGRRHCPTNAPHPGDPHPYITHARSTQPDRTSEARTPSSAHEALTSMCMKYAPHPFTNRQTPISRPLHGDASRGGDVAACVRLGCSAEGTGLGHLRTSMCVSYHASQSSSFIALRASVNAGSLPRSQAPSPPASARPSLSALLSLTSRCSTGPPRWSPRRPNRLLYPCDHTAASLVGGPSIMRCLLRALACWSD
jgi:hypothetical protein